jgi:hypothetical protein
MRTIRLVNDDRLTGLCALRLQRVFVFVDEHRRTDARPRMW